MVLCSSRPKYIFAEFLSSQSIKLIEYLEEREYFCFDMSVVVLQDTDKLMFKGQQVGHSRPRSVARFPTPSRLPGTHQLCACAGCDEQAHQNHDGQAPDRAVREEPRELAAG